MAAVGQGFLSSVGRIAGRPARQYRWTTLIGLAEAAIAKRRLAEADEQLAEAVAFARAEWPASPRLGESLARLADIRAAFERTDDALRLYGQAIAVLGSLPAGINSTLAHIVSNLGRLFLLKGERSKAEALVSAALALQRKLGVPDTPVLKFNLALAAAEARREHDAHRAFNEAIGALERQAGARDLLGIALHDNFALLCQSRGRHDDAEGLLRRCLILRQEAAGPRHPIYAAGLINLARLQLDRSRVENARGIPPGADEIEALLWQAADICKRHGERPTAGLLPALYYQARLAQRRGHGDDSRALCAQLLDFGDSDRSAADAAEVATLHVLACEQMHSAESTGGGDADPERILRRAIALADRLPGAHRAFGREIKPDLLSDLAILLGALGRSAEAERVATKASELMRSPAWAVSRHVFPSV